MAGTESVTPPRENLETCGEPWLGRRGGSGVLSIRAEVVLEHRGQKGVMRMDLDHRQAGFIHACQQLSPIHPEHATLPIQKGFNWSSWLGDAHFEQLYLVVFRSVLRAEADRELLREHDERAHAEALQAGGLLFYYRGVMNERRECLSFCLWESREQARRASSSPLHRAAMGIAAEMYESFSLERYDLVKVGGINGRLVFRPLAGAASGQDPGESGQLA